MRRYFIDPKFKHEDKINLEGDDFHHIIDVCRQSVGSQFEVLFGDGKACLVEIQSAQKKSAQAVMLKVRDIPPLKQPHLHLCLSIPKFAVFDAVLEKSVELGVHTVHPFYSQHSFVKAQEGVNENRVERWQKIVKSATQQSGRGELLEVAKPLKLAELLKSINQKADAAGLFGYEGESHQTMKTWVSATKKGPNLSQIYLFVGGEGGFSKEEVQLFQSFDLQPVTLGDQVLRVETACVAMIGILKYEWDL